MQNVSCNPFTCHCCKQIVGLESNHFHLHCMAGTQVESRVITCSLSMLNSIYKLTVLSSLLILTLSEIDLSGTQVVIVSHMSQVAPYHIEPLHKQTANTPSPSYSVMYTNCHKRSLESCKGPSHGILCYEYNCAPLLCTSID